MATENAEDLAALFAQPKVVTVGGLPMQIGPLKVRQFAAFSKASEDLVPYTLAGNYLGAVVNKLDAVLAVLEIVTGRPAATFEELAPDAVTEALAAVMEYNIGFFAYRLLPQKEAAQARMQALAEKLVGQQPSPVSSDGATASTPSAT